jgi:hypothetical protein
MLTSPGLNALAMDGIWGEQWIGAVARVVAVVVLASSCTLYHSKIPIAGNGDSEVAPDAVFVTEDDSGLALLGIFVISEPDHYSVLVERARRRYKCERLHHIQLDFYSDYWLFVGFPIARITAICDPAKDDERSAPSVSPKSPSEPAPKQPKPLETETPTPPPTPALPVAPEEATPPDAIVPG